MGNDAPLRQRAKAAISDGIVLGVRWFLAILIVGGLGHVLITDYLATRQQASQAFACLSQPKCMADVIERTRQFQQQKTVEPAR